MIALLERVILSVGPYPSWLRMLFSSLFLKAFKFSSENSPKFFIDYRYTGKNMWEIPSYLHSYLSIYKFWPIDNSIKKAFAHSCFLSWHWGHKWVIKNRFLVIVLYCNRVIGHSKWYAPNKFLPCFLSSHQKYVWLWEDGILLDHQALWNLLVLRQA